MTGYQARWEYCPFCGHLIYQHDGNGCTHTEVQADPVWLQTPQGREWSATHGPCDCTVNLHWFERISR